MLSAVSATLSENTRDEVDDVTILNIDDTVGMFEIILRERSKIVAWTVHQDVAQWMELLALLRLLFDR